MLNIDDQQRTDRRATDQVTSHGAFKQAPNNAQGKGSSALAMMSVFFLALGYATAIYSTAVGMIFVAAAVVCGFISKTTLGRIIAWGMLALVLSGAAIAAVYAIPR